MTRLAPGAIHDLYGLTETGSCDFCLNPAHQPHGFGTIGYPTARVAFRLARDGPAVVAGETGELQIRTPFGMLGYLDNPELTDASFDGDYFRTGDLARMTVNGYVELVGRAKDIIHVAVKGLRHSRLTISWENIPMLQQLSARAFPMSASARSFTLSSSRVQAPT